MTQTLSTVLVVDDAAPLRTAFGRVLQRVGYDVGSSIQNEIDQAGLSAANDFKRKPVDLGYLITTVAAALELPGPRQQAAEAPWS